MQQSRFLIGSSKWEQDIPEENKLVIDVEEKDEHELIIICDIYNKYFEIVHNINDHFNKMKKVTDFNEILKLREKMINSGFTWNIDPVVAMTPEIFTLFKEPFIIEKKIITRVKSTHDFKRVDKSRAQYFTLKMYERMARDYLKERETFTPEGKRQTVKSAYGDDIRYAKEHLEKNTITFYHDAKFQVEFTKITGKIYARIFLLDGTPFYSFTSAPVSSMTAVLNEIAKIEKKFIMFPIHKQWKIKKQEELKQIYSEFDKANLEVTGRKSFYG